MRKNKFFGLALVLLLASCSGSNPTSSEDKKGSETDIGSEIVFNVSIDAKKEKINEAQARLKEIYDSAKCADKSNLLLMYNRGCSLIAGAEENEIESILNTYISKMNQEIADQIEKESQVSLSDAKIAGKKEVQDYITESNLKDVSSLVPIANIYYARINSCDSKDAIKLIVNEAKAALDVEISKLKTIEVGHEFFAKKVASSGAGFGVANDGAIMQSDRDGWSSISFGDNENKYQSFEFDIIPVYSSAIWSTITLRFRSNGNSSSYSIFASTDYVFPRKNDSLCRDKIYNFGLWMNEINHVKILCDNSKKSVIINDEVVFYTDETDLTTGLFVIETWQTSYSLYNPILTTFNDENGLVSKYPEIRNSVEYTYNDEYPVNDKLASVLKGKNLSLLADSITTYSGVSNDTSVNSTIGNNGVFYEASSNFGSVDRTYWMQLVKATQMNLCVNNAWAGSTAAVTYDDVSCTCNSRATQLHRDSGELSGMEPDIIILFIGTNDFDMSVPLGSFTSLEDIYENGIYNSDAPKSFATALAKTQHQISVRYPNADLFCCTLWENLVRHDVEVLNQFNEVIRNVTNYFGNYICDFHDDIGFDVTNCGRYFNDTVFIHPNGYGFDMMTACLERTFEKVYLQE